MLFYVEAALEFNFEVSAKYNDHCQKANSRKRKQYDVGPIVGVVPKAKHNTRTNHRYDFKKDEGEHIVFLPSQVGKKEDYGYHKSAKANNGNDEQSKAMYQEDVNQCQQNTGPSHNLDRLAHTVVFHKVGGEDQSPNDVECNDCDDAPQRTGNSNVDDHTSGCCREERPTQNA